MTAVCAKRDAPFLVTTVRGGAIIRKGAQIPKGAKNTFYCDCSFTHNSYLFLLHHVQFFFLVYTGGLRGLRGPMGCLQTLLGWMFFGSAALTTL